MCEHTCACVYMCICMCVGRAWCNSRQFRFGPQGFTVPWFLWLRHWERAQLMDGICDLPLAGSQVLAGVLFSCRLSCDWRIHFRVGSLTCLVSSSSYWPGAFMPLHKDAWHVVRAQELFFERYLRDKNQHKPWCSLSSSILKTKGQVFSERNSVSSKRSV